MQWNQFSYTFTLRCEDTFYGKDSSTSQWHFHQNLRNPSIGRALDLAYQMVRIAQFKWIRDGENMIDFDHSERAY